MPEEKSTYNAQPGAYGPALPTATCNLCGQPVIIRQAMIIDDGVYRHQNIFECQAATQHALRLAQARIKELEALSHA